MNYFVWIPAYAGMTLCHPLEPARHASQGVAGGGGDPVYNYLINYE